LDAASLFGNNTNADAGAGLPHDKTLTVVAPRSSHG